MTFNFNPQACAELHNAIVRIGWQGRTGSEELDPSAFFSFWESQTESHEQIQLAVRAEVVDFYKLALVPKPGHEYGSFSFHLGVLAHPCHPEEILEHLRMSEGHERSPRGPQRQRILLYRATIIESQPIGLIFDQTSGLSIVQGSMWSCDLGGDPILPWQRVETVLRQYLDMIYVGKITPVSPYTGRPPWGEEPSQDPWHIRSYTAPILDLTLRAYARLIKAIENRIQSENPEIEASEERPLATEEILDQNEYPPDNFIRKFLTQAKTSKYSQIKYIAPGITLPTTSTLSHQPFKELARSNKHSMQFNSSGTREFAEGECPRYPPWLLFPSDKHEQVSFPVDDAGGSDIELSPFRYPFHSITILPAGLWLDAADALTGSDGQDAAILILPFDIGGPGTSTKYVDGAPLSMPERLYRVDHHRPSKWELYQTRYNPFVRKHWVHLRLILERWAQMVEDGTWKVNEEGVMGGIEVFLDANHAATAKHYTTRLQW